MSDEAIEAGLSHAKSALPGALSKGARFTLSCNDPRLVIVGLDRLDLIGPEHELYQKHRIQGNDKKRAGLRASIELMGFVETLPIILEKHKSTKDAFLVVDGRQKLLAAREVSAAKSKDIPVSVVIEKPDEDDKAHFLKLMIVANTRVPMSPLAVADDVLKATMLAKPGMDGEEPSLTEEDLDGLFPFGKRQRDNYLKLLSLAPEVQAAVEAGKVGLNAAVDFAAVPVGEQSSKLKELLDSGATAKEVNREVKTAAKKSRATRKGKDASEVSSKPGTRIALKVCARHESNAFAVEGTGPLGFWDGVKWALGQYKGRIKGMTAALEAVRPKKRGT